MEMQAPGTLSTRNIYLERYGYSQRLIAPPPSPTIGVVVTVPCFNEPDLFTSLDSLKSCQRPACDVEVIVLLNQPTRCEPTISEQNRRTVRQFKEWVKRDQRAWLRFFLVERTDIAARQAGVGFARKMAMDEAVRRLGNVGNDQGIIVGFDADCQCDPNYLTALEHHFAVNNTDGCSIYFEHPIHDGLGQRIREGITQYELHLRYFINALEYAGFPFAFQTLGSAMAVRSSVYQNQGGMNRRKAGEDFHFLQKVIAQGKFSTLNSTRIIPSPRISHRVPFGTGKAMADWSTTDATDLLTYNPDTFELLKRLNMGLRDFFQADSPRVQSWINQWPSEMASYLNRIQLVGAIAEVNRQSTRPDVYRNRLYRWMSALRTIKMIHYIREVKYPDVEVGEASRVLLERMDYRPLPSDTPADLLRTFRSIDRSK